MCTRSQEVETSAIKALAELTTQIIKPSACIEADYFQSWQSCCADMTSRASCMDLRHYIAMQDCPTSIVANLEEIKTCNERCAAAIEVCRQVERAGALVNTCIQSHSAFQNSPATKSAFWGADNELGSLRETLVKGDGPGRAVLAEAFRNWRDKFSVAAEGHTEYEDSRNIFLDLVKVCLEAAAQHREAMSPAEIHKLAANSQDNAFQVKKVAKFAPDQDHAVRSCIVFALAPL